MGVLLLALVLRVAWLDQESLWFDETFTSWWTKQTLAELWGPNGRLETNPPLYYSLTRLHVDLLGDGEAALRLPAALIGTLCVGAVFLLGRMIGGVKVGLLAALLTAIAAPHVRYSQEARGYALLSLLGILAVLGCLLFFQAAATQQIRRRQAAVGLALYVIATLGALYTHNTAVLLPAFANAAALVWWFLHSRRLLPVVIWLSANLLILAGWSWWVPTLLDQSKSAVSLDWLVQPSAGWAAREWVRFFGLRYLHGYELIQAVPGLIVLGFAAVACLLRPGIATLLPALCVVGMPAALFTLGLVARPAWAERYFFWPFPLAMILVAIGLLELRPAWARAGAIAAALALSMLNLGLYYTVRQKEPFREVIALIAEELGPGDGVLFVPGVQSLAAAYYQLKRNLVLDTYGVEPAGGGHSLGMPFDILPLQPPAARQPTVLHVDDLPRLRAEHGRIWIVYRRKERSDPKDLVQKVLGSVGRVILAQDFAPFLKVVLIEFPAVPLPYAGEDARDDVH